MRLHYLQHVPFEGPGSIAQWAADRRHELVGCHLYRGDPLPDIAEIEWLVVMGGPMGVEDRNRIPWMDREIEFIREAISRNCRVLGICLGAQLIAHVLGAEVYPNKEKEIGWFPVKGIELAEENGFPGIPETFLPLHWHGDTFDLPVGAQLLATSDGCRNQAFLWKSRVLALQFHLEATPESLRGLVDNCREEITTGPWQMPPKQILNEISNCEDLPPMVYSILDYLARDF